MATLNLIFAVIAAAAAAWWVTRIITERRQSEHIETLESKIRVAESDAVHLKEQVGTLRGEVVALQKTLSDERVSKQEALNSLTGAFQKGIIGIAMAAFVTGSAVAGGFAWMASSWHTELKMTAKNTEEKVQYELTKLKLELLEKQYDKSEKDREHFQSAWQEERILRATAETRLEAMARGFDAPENFGNVFLNDSGVQDENSSKSSPGKFMSLIRGASFRA